jgi:hypothetical protein
LHNQVAVLLPIAAIERHELAGKTPRAIFPVALLQIPIELLRRRMMFHPDDTFNFHNEIMALAEEFCQEWVRRQGPFESKLEGALIMNFALCTIQHDLEEILDQLEQSPVFEGISPREVYKRGGFGEETPPGLSNEDVAELVRESLSKIHRN